MLQSVSKWSCDASFYMDFDKTVGDESPPWKNSCRQRSLARSVCLICIWQKDAGRPQSTS